MTTEPEPHRIRLAGPWQQRLNDGKSQKIRLPFEWTEQQPEIHAERSFNGSEGVLQAASIRLQVLFSGEPPKVLVNQQSVNVDHPDSLRNGVEVKSLLNRSNLLQLTCCQQSGSKIDEVSLLIFD